jgi:hypothetical protein
MHTSSIVPFLRRYRSASVSAFLCVALALGGVAGARAANRPAATYWSGRAGGYGWRFTTSDITATGKKPRLSLQRKLIGKARGELEGYTAYRITVEPLSLVGSLLCYRRDDYWEGGAHPSGAIGYDHVDAARPERTLLLTDLFPDAAVRDALWNDSIVRKTLAGAGVKTRPATSKALVTRLAMKRFTEKEGGDEIEYIFPQALLSQFAFHHLEGNKVAVRLCIPWGAEIFRFRSTELGILLPIPARLRPSLQAAAAGRAGFLTRGAKARFRERDTVLFDAEEK